MAGGGGGKRMRELEFGDEYRATSVSVVKNKGALPRIFWSKLGFAAFTE